MNHLLAYIGDLSGPAYNWLGHFRSSACLEVGHNESDAEALDETIQRLGEGRLPNKISSDTEGP